MGGVPDPMVTSPRRTAAASGSVRLSLIENVVLALIVAGPTHGFAISRELGATGRSDAAYEVPRPLVYRAIDRLVDAALVSPLRIEAGDHGPPRTVVMATGPGRRAAQRWLRTPAEHVRDVRTELLVKLALLHRSGSDPEPLLRAQRRVLAPIVAALEEQCERSEGFEKTVARWRYETALAALRFAERAP